MKLTLLLNKTSPYSRVVRIVAMEKGMEADIELVWSDPWGEDQRLTSFNPANKVPVLVTESGVAITESLLIVNYLDICSPDLSPICLIKQENQMQLIGYAQSMMDASFNEVICKKYSKETSEDSVMSQRRLDTIKRTLEYFSSQLSPLDINSSLSKSDIFIAVALDYLDFRLPDLYRLWSGADLIDWHKETVKNNHFIATSFN